MHVTFVALALCG